MPDSAAPIGDDAGEPTVRSGMEGLAWPGIPDAAGRTLLALLFQLERSQWWSPEALRRHQFRQLETLVRHAAATTSFHLQRLAMAGIDPSAPLDDATWSRVPLLSRRDLQQAGSAIQSTAVPAGHGRLKSTSTSGSTGTPVTLQSTDLAGLFWSAFYLRHRLWHRFDLQGKLASIRYVGTRGAAWPEGRSAPGWGPPVETVFPTGPAVALDIMTPVSRQAEWLQREDPDILLTYPTNLMALLSHSRDHGQRPQRLKQVETIGELLGPEVRAACRETWGLNVIDAYTTQEAGYLALQCPEHEHYHLQSEGVLVEILDDTGRPCGAGETGRVVVTSLHNFATPLIRYAIGDYAVVGEPCDCGRGLPVLARIMGRARNMLTLPSGEQIWPFFGGKKFADVAPIRQYQVAQTSREELEVRLVPTAPLTPEHEARISAVLDATLGPGFRYRFTYHAEIPRSAGGKYEDFRSELPD